mmetsp:Transcript_15805/g.26675  ORF Transcript_15805/g.26675 Transcript_15805/m.26675 type:complete len:211 (+) Transcript_15805:1580-2212(+)
MSLRLPRARRHARRSARRRRRSATGCGPMAVIQTRSWRWPTSTSTWPSPGPAPPRLAPRAPPTMPGMTRAPPTLFCRWRAGTCVYVRPMCSFADAPVIGLGHLGDARPKQDPNLGRHEEPVARFARASCRMLSSGKCTRAEVTGVRASQQSARGAQEWGSWETTKSGKRAGTVKVRLLNSLTGFLMYSIVVGRVGGERRLESGNQAICRE